MKFKLLSLSLAAILSQQAFAIQEQPKACPAVAALQTGGFSLVSDSGIAGWIAMNNDTYGTEEEWSFAMFVGNAQNEDEARAKADDNVELLYLLSGPEASDEGKWSCLYMTNGESFLSIAVTPSIFPNPQYFVSKLKNRS